MKEKISDEAVEVMVRCWKEAKERRDENFARSILKSLNEQGVYRHGSIEGTTWRRVNDDSFRLKEAYELLEETLGWPVTRERDGVRWYEMGPELANRIKALLSDHND